MKWAETHLLLRKCMAVSLASSSSERACVCWVLQMAVARSLDLGACTLNTCTEWTVSSALRAAGRGGGKRNRGWVRSGTSTSSTAGMSRYRTLKAVFSDYTNIQGLQAAIFASRLCA